MYCVSVIVDIVIIELEEDHNYCLSAPLDSVIEWNE